MLDTINHNETVSMYRKSYQGDRVTLQKFANYQRYKECTQHTHVHASGWGRNALITKSDATF